MSNHQIHCRYFSQEDLLGAGCLDMRMAMDAAEGAIRSYHRGDVLFPEKIVQIFDDQTQERINCLPATFKPQKVCGVKWVSVFPPNPENHGVQNLSAVIILSEIERGFPIAFMEGTLCSNIRVGCMGALAAQYLARPDAQTIGFIGAGEQAKMHLIAMKTVLPSLTHCRVAAKLETEEQQFVREMAPIVPDMTIEAAGTDLERATRDADVIVTATRSATPLFDGGLVKAGAFVAAVGTSTPTARELDDALLGRASLVAVEWLGAARHEAGELVLAAPGVVPAERLVELGALLVEPRPRGPLDIVVYKSVGIGLEDGALARLVARRLGLC
jgi:ornithine cyclodeaminase/alanine dehydrogenase-like protein (mu-crystallin family)